MHRIALLFMLGTLSGLSQACVTPEPTAGPTLQPAAESASEPVMPRSERAHAFGGMCRIENDNPCSGAFEFSECSYDGRADPTFKCYKVSDGTCVCAPCKVQGESCQESAECCVGLGCGVLSQSCQYVI